METDYDSNRQACPRFSLILAAEDRAVNQAEFKAIVAEGSAAFHAGSARSDNPFFKWQKMPVCTGESLESWRMKCDAWIAGFTSAEDTMLRKTRSQHTGEP